MELILLRHGIPVEPDDWSNSDAARPLTPEGRVQTRAVIATLARVGKLRGFGGATGVIWSSPYVRAEQTAKVAANILRGSPPVACPALASGMDLIRSLPAFAATLDPDAVAGTASALLRWPERLLCVGHQPDLGNLISRLVGAPVGRYALSRSGLARLTGDFRAGGMKLEWILTADEALELEE